MDTALVSLGREKSHSLITGNHARERTQESKAFLIPALPMAAMLRSKDRRGSTCSSIVGTVMLTGTEEALGLRLAYWEFL